MAVLRLTPDNLTFVKRELRRAYPHIKSSHLSEGLAAALGSNTNAALIAKTKNAPSGSLACLLSLPRWRARLTDLGCTLEEHPLINIVRAADLPDRCWQEIPTRDVDRNNSWFRYCQRHDIPNVFINLGPKYARLRWDCISTSGRGDKGVRGEASGPLMRSLFTTFQEHARLDSGRPVFEGSSFVGTIEGLLHPTARDLADSIFLSLFLASRDVGNEEFPKAA